MMTSEPIVKVKGRWTPEQDKLLGTDPDADIGRRLGCNEVTVRARRVRLGIPATCHVVPWTPEEDRLLGTLPDEELARKLGRSFDAVAKVGPTKKRHHQQCHDEWPDS
jgi:hypothetical protein